MRLIETEANLVQTNIENNGTKLANEHAKSAIEVLVQPRRILVQSVPRSHMEYVH